MVLVPLASRRPVVAFGVVSFFMQDDDKTVRVDVGQELLKHMDGKAPPSQGGYIERCERHRRFFARLADEKYRKGNFEPEVKVLVVRITEDDL